MAGFAPPLPTLPAAGPELRRRVATAALVLLLGVALLVAVPGLRPVLTEIQDMSPGWVAAAIVLELLSCVSFVVVFRLFFGRVPRRDARELGWTSMASGALLPVGGAGGLAISGALMRLSGLPTAWIVRRSSGLFFLTSAFNMAVVGAAGVLLLVGPAGPGDFLHAALPVIGAATLTLTVATLPRLADRRRQTPFLTQLAAGIRDAESTLAHPSWRLAGAAGYLGFDIAVLWATFSALGSPPPLGALILGYSIGYLANALPVPGGIGVVDGGLAGALLLYGAPAAHVAAAVLVYRTIAVWLPGLGGLLAYTRLRRRLTTAPSLPSKEAHDDRTRDDDQTHPGWLGRVPDEWPRADPLPRDRLEAAGPALPGPPVG
jgi:uncharacterized membrane protein YbhN (UPF0104 family)